MNLSITGEFLIVLVVNIISVGIYVGSLRTAMHFFEKQLGRLEEAQRRYNDVIMRTFKLEERADAHDKRLDELHEDIKDLRGV